MESIELPVSVWLQGSGWAQALVQAEIAKAGTADSLQAAHVMCTRTHQITAAALHVLQHHDMPTTITVQMANILWSLRSGVIRESKVVLSFSFGQQYWSYNFVLLCMCGP